MEKISNSKDTDQKILLFLPDKDLLATCSLNRYFYYSVCDYDFFRRKLEHSYPDTLKYFNLNSDKNYKRYYLKIVYYVSEMLEKYKYSYVSGNPKLQYNIFTRCYYMTNDTTQFLINYSELLFISAKEGELNLVKEAIKNGAKINEAKEYALRTASKYGHLNIIKYLVENGANIHINNDTPLKWAIGFGDSDVINYLKSLN